MKRAARFGTAALVAAHVGMGFAQAPGLSGTWKLDRTRSRVTEAAGLAGLIAVGAPDTLHVTQASNGTLIVESQINESHSRVYTPGATSSTPVSVGQGGSITVRSRWEGGTLVSEGSRQSASGSSIVVTEVKEVFSLSPDGRTLTIEVTTAGAGVTSTSSLIYTRTPDVGPCQSWPTPCKTFGR